MPSTFMGLETARRALSAQQTALSTVSNNVANANTEGYTRQRVTLQSTSPYPAVSKNSDLTAGQIGTGVKAGSVERVRDSFLDYQYRTENTKLGYYTARSNSLSQMEGVMKELDDNGLNGSLSSFWNALQDLATNPENTGARSVLQEQGKSLAESFNYISTSLTNIQGDIKKNLDNTADQVNSILNQLNDLNNQIAAVEPSGMLPNDLYDQRDRLIDQLSSMANIKVSYNKSGGHALATAEGTVNVELLNGNNNSLGTLLDGNTKTVSEMKINYDKDSGLVSSVSVGSSTVNADAFTGKGSLLGLIESYGYMSNGEEKGLYPEMLTALDNMALSFADAFNAVHEKGKTYTGEQGAAFFDFIGGEAVPAKGAAAKIKVSDKILASTDNIAASLNGEKSDGTNATNLAAVQNSKLTINGETTTINDFYESLIGKLGVNSQKAANLMNNSESNTLSADERRQSVSAVSLDEEMTNMIQFQHAYNAAARIITMQDEIFDKIINGMGTGGR
ncbi:flagellar hook-associated protein FlgK [Bacillus velezensis]|uniref:flagellar hook-associated protein FlgK n=1 Tax=Bacillus velezensis TaxID=492670 RepID=UPI002DBA847A|nr:flagellar hook-associated protein FlgK [Bacillus velezensis]MEC1372259.1 flagellar hook-associated protein FlgK [Bacillus velezensis]